MTARERLREAAGAFAEAFLDAVAEAGEAPPSDPSAELLTVSEAGAVLHRRPSTIRQWCAGGLFEGAVKLRGRSWCIPRAALLAFVERERVPAADPLPRRIPASLGDWRRALPRSEPPAEG